jgi:hypothetical protein
MNRWNGQIWDYKRKLLLAQYHVNVKENNPKWVFLAWIPQTQLHSKAKKWSWLFKDGFSNTPLTYPKNAAGITKTIWTTLNALSDMQLKLPQNKTSNKYRMKQKN